MLSDLEEQIILFYNISQAEVLCLLFESADKNANLPFVMALIIKHWIFEDDVLFDWEPMKFVKGSGDMIMTFDKEHDNTGK